MALTTNPTALTADWVWSDFEIKIDRRNTMDENTISEIREDVLYDPRYPIHLIADRFLPYLRVLVEQFHPEQVILFGSYTYGEPDEHSDIDLLVVKPFQERRLKDKIAIRAAWWPLLLKGSPLSFDLLLSNPDEHAKRSLTGSIYYKEITEKGLRLA